MGKIFKYLFYVALILVVYLVGKGIYEGEINDKTTVGEVVSDVKSGTKEMVRDGVNETKDALDNYEAAPKKEIKVGEQENLKSLFGGAFSYPAAYGG